MDAISGESVADGLTPAVENSFGLSAPYANSAFRQRVKRLIDVLGAGLLLIALSPLFLLLAIAVKLSSPGEIFSRWKVAGQSGRPFVGYKFRSMVRNADDLKAKLEAANEMA